VFGRRRRAGAAHAVCGMRTQTSTLTPVCVSLHPPLSTHHTHTHTRTHAHTRTHTHTPRHHTSFHTLVAGGGDGTLNELVAALLARGAPRHVAVAQLPLGTANDLASAGGISLVRVCAHARARPRCACVARAAAARARTAMPIGLLRPHLPNNAPPPPSHAHTRAHVHTHHATRHTPHASRITPHASPSGPL
jgi:hypothetical protein